MMRSKIWAQKIPYATGNTLHFAFVWSTFGLGSRGHISSSSVRRPPPPAPAPCRKTESCENARAFLLGRHGDVVCICCWLSKHGELVFKGGRIWIKIGYYIFLHINTLHDNFENQVLQQLPRFLYLVLIVM